MSAMQEDSTAYRGVFQVDEDRALAELELTWAGGGHHGFSADRGTWSAISSAGELLVGCTPNELTVRIQAHLEGDAVISDATAPVPADGLACQVCQIADPRPDPTCFDGVDHRVGRTPGCPHCGRLREACARRPCFESMHEVATMKAQLVPRSRLAQRLATRPAAGGADQ